MSPTAQELRTQIAQQRTQIATAKQQTEQAKRQITQRELRGLTREQRLKQGIEFKKAKEEKLQEIKQAESKFEQEVKPVEQQLSKYEKELQYQKEYELGQMYAQRGKTPYGLSRIAREGYNATKLAYAQYSQSTFDLTRKATKKLELSGNYKIPDKILNEKVSFQDSKLKQDLAKAGVGTSVYFKPSDKPLPDNSLSVLEKAKAVYLTTPFAINIQVTPETNVLRETGASKWVSGLTYGEAKQEILRSKQLSSLAESQKRDISTFQKAVESAPEEYKSQVYEKGLDELAQRGIKSVPSELVTSGKEKGSIYFQSEALKPKKSFNLYQWEKEDKPLGKALLGTRVASTEATKTYFITKGIGLGLSPVYATGLKYVPTATKVLSAGAGLYLGGSYAIGTAKNYMGAGSKAEKQVILLETGGQVAGFATAVYEKQILNQMDKFLKTQEQLMKSKKAQSGSGKTRQKFQQKTEQVEKKEGIDRKNLKEILKNADKNQVRKILDEGYKRIDNSGLSDTNKIKLKQNLLATALEAKTGTPIVLADGNIDLKSLQYAINTYSSSSGITGGSIVGATDGGAIQGSNFRSIFWVGAKDVLDSKQKNLFITDQKFGSPQDSKVKSKIISSFATKTTQEQKTKTSLIDLQALSQSSLLKSNQLQNILSKTIQQPKTNQLERSTTKQKQPSRTTNIFQKPITTQKPQEKPKKYIGFGIGSEQLKRIAKRTTEEPELFEVFGKRFGRDISLLKTPSKLKAEKGLLGFLRGTLGRSGYVLKGGQKVGFKEFSLLSKNPTLRPSKKDSTRIVQKAKYSLGTGAEVREIQYFKKKSSKKSRNKNLFF